ncbi:MAG: DUF6445 family protein [Pseudomonadota bacterium]
MPLHVKLNPNPTVEQVPLGGRAFAVTIDDFLANPDELVDYAADHVGDFFTPEHGYPGMNLVLPLPALDAFHRFILKKMGPTFGFLRGGATFGTGLSMVTFPEERLQNFQRLCHTDPRDSAERVKFATMVYLFDDPDLGGTAFYRWKKPEVIHEALALEMRDPAATTALLAEHCEAFRQPPRYLTGSNELAEQIAVVPPRFNRLIAYSGEVPHSGYITKPERLTQDVRKGRLTLNCFASVIPKSS